MTVAAANMGVVIRQRTDPATDLQLLQAAPDGLAEYALIQQLKARHSGHLPNLPLTDKLVLFRTHFLLFNALYRLRDQLRQAQTYLLEISPLCIRLLPYQPGTLTVLPLLCMLSVVASNTKSYSLDLPADSTSKPSTCAQVTRPMSSEG